MANRLDRFTYKPYAANKPSLRSAYLDLGVIEFSVFNFPTDPDPRMTFRINGPLRLFIDLKIGRSRAQKTQPRF